MSINAQILALRAKRKEKETALEALAGSVKELGFTDDSRAQFDALEKELIDITDDLARLEKAEKALAAAAVPITPAPVTVKEHEEVVAKGVTLIRHLKCLNAAKGSHLLAAELAASHYPHQRNLSRLLKAQGLGQIDTDLKIAVKAAVPPATTTDATWAGPLVFAQNAVAEFIELLRPATILGQISGQRMVPFNISIPRQTSGVAANWVGENALKPVSKAAFDRVTFPWAKVVSISAFSDELMRFSDPSIDVLLRNDMVDAIAQFVDISYIDYAQLKVVNVRPGPITGDGAGARINGADSTGNTLAAIAADLAAAMTFMTTNGITMRAPYWVMSARTFTFLSLLRTAQDLYAFRDELMDGKLLGATVVVSGNVPSTGGVGTNESFITLMDASEQLMAQDPSVSFDMSTEASLRMDDAPTGATALTSLWQNNLVAIKAEQYLYWERRRNPAVYVISKVTY